MRKCFTRKSYLFLLVGLYSCEQKNQKEINTNKPQPAPSAFTIPAPDKPTSYQDTLFIQDEFATQPFSVDSISTHTVQRLFKTEQVIKKPVVNKFTAQQIDTLITIRQAHSYVRLYQVSTEANKFFYQSALIQDSMRVFSQPLQIGLTKEQVKKIFSPLAQEKSLPDIIQISNGTSTDYLYLIFRNNKLNTVKFQPYLD
ncbi:hypothetical protein [Adhaeribacter pallidiroseus]|uniref:Uncharacterized protein n=1 Tax=Adhaeribacter pallidiroseus TaxID=2072847 RepID=A0A369QHE2_9BACT|nr:hypothetical protein [Adhaeribacter pallidiroseus]RDC61708.1 hypothetical protein AHMF7616_00289 [Adhaeribacter pallidiroseus]